MTSAPTPDSATDSRSSAPGASPAAPASPVRLREVAAGGGGVVRFSVPGTDYRIETAAGESLAGASAGQRLQATLHAVARKVWPVSAGGRFVEPVFGRPRRIQALVLAVDEGGNRLHLDAGGLKVVARLSHPGQRAGDFPPQTLVTMGIDDHTVLEAAPKTAP